LVHLEARRKSDGPPEIQLEEVLRRNLRSVHAYFLKEGFQRLCEYESPTWAGKLLDSGRRNVMLSHIEPIKNIAPTCRRHRELILS